MSSLGTFLRWGMVGGSQFATIQSDHELQSSLISLAKCLTYLRTYLKKYGMPIKGGTSDQQQVLREVVRDLYAGGTPLWALEPVMQKAAEGLTGQSHINWQLFPRKALLYFPNNNNTTTTTTTTNMSMTTGTTLMFRMDRGFNISKMSHMEGVVVRLASFASNVSGVSNIPARFPHPYELVEAAATAVTAVTAPNNLPGLCFYCRLLYYSGRHRRCRRCSNGGGGRHSSTNFSKRTTTMAVI